MAARSRTDQLEDLKAELPGSRTRRKPSAAVLAAEAQAIAEAHAVLAAEAAANAERAQAEGTADSLGEEISAAEHLVERIVSAPQRVAAEAKATVEATALTLTGQVKTLIIAHPMAALAVAFSIGLVLGRGRERH